MTNYPSLMKDPDGKFRPHIIPLCHETFGLMADAQAKYGISITELAMQAGRAQMAESKYVEGRC